MSKLDDILDFLGEGYIMQEHYLTSTTRADELAMTKQDIKELILEIIGEDMPLNTEPNTGQLIHNKVKAEQRKRLEELYKGNK